MQGVSLALGYQTQAAKRRVHEHHDEDKKESISEFKHAVSEDDKPKKARKIIPCKPNKVFGKPKEDPATVGKLEDRFQTATKQEEGSSTYGLIKRTSTDGASARSQPVAASTPARSAAQSEGTKLGISVAELADEPTIDGYEDMPVEDFGLALLRGMGMTEENKVETVQYVARPARMGLGVDPKNMGAYWLQSMLTHATACRPDHDIPLAPAVHAPVLNRGGWL